MYFEYIYRPSPRQKYIHHNIKSFSQLPKKHNKKHYFTSFQISHNMSIKIHLIPGFHGISGNTGNNTDLPSSHNNHLHESRSNANMCSQPQHEGRQQNKHTVTIYIFKRKQNQTKLEDRKNKKWKPSTLTNAKRLIMLMFKLTCCSADASGSESIQGMVNSQADTYMMGADRNVPITIPEVTWAGTRSSQKYCGGTLINYMSQSN